MKDYSTSEKMSMYNSRKLDTGKIWLMFLFFGWSHGAMGKIGIQILFYITCGGMGLWALSRMLKLGRKMKEFNKNIAIEIGLTHQDMSALGLL